MSTGLSASADSIDYTVKAGDTLSTIASKQLPSLELNDAINKIATTNNLADANVIVAGEKLTIPDTDTTVSAPVTAPVTTAPVTTQKPVQQTVQATPQTVKAAPQTVATTTTQVAPKTTATPVVQSTPTDGSTHSQFLAAGGTEAMWNTIVMPESGGNPNAVSSAGYRGLGQTKQNWGSGSVASQTQGMVNYATSRYGSVNNAVNFRTTHGWW